ncbi:MAG TPA: DUF5668 domain-containing protein [Chryseosolibacter sp.]|nr:DUF5668 domain-containing protein [Chryseosolibacter sp.]
METENRRTLENQGRPGEGFNWREPAGSKSGRIFGGLIFVTVGVVILAERMGVYFPDWLISWPMLMLAIGLFIGVRHSFRGSVWLILVVSGSLFLVHEIEPSMRFNQFIWPAILIAIGLALILRPKKKQIEPFAGLDRHTADPASPEDVIDSVVVFGGVKRKIISKTFRGGELTTIFGGTEIDLTHADVSQPIDLELTQIFGGTKLVVPPHWRIHSEDLVSIFGGLDDKRMVQTDVNPDPAKVLILRGTCIFGGIDIKSF